MSKQTTPGGSEYVPQIKPMGEDGHEYDSLAELFLGDASFAPPRAAAGAEGFAELSAAPAEPDDPQDDSQSESTQTVEVVVLGHLPVRASIWVRQHAGEVAKRHGSPVALLRIGPAMASIELIGTGADRIRQRSSTIAEAITTACEHTNRWVVRVDETTEPGLSNDERVDEVTVLTGADEAAVVSSYRLIKSLVAGWDRAFGEDNGPKLRATIMGGDDEHTADAVAKLDRAAGAFLHRPLTIETGERQIGSGTGATLFRGQPDQAVDVLLGSIKAHTTGDATAATKSTPTPSLRLTRPATSETDERVNTPRIITSSWAPNEPQMDAAEPMDIEVDLEETAPADAPPIQHKEAPMVDLDKPAVAPALGNKPTIDPPQVVTRAVGAIAPKPVQPAAASQIGVHEQDGPPSLPGLVEGVVALESRCPTVPGIELGADENGRLHILAADTGGHDARVIDRLIMGAAWARQHLPLLLRAEPTLGHPSSDRADEHDPILHVLTTDARSARPLLDADFRVHLIRRVEIAGHSAWICDELN